MKRSNRPDETPSAEMADRKLADALTGLTDAEKADVWDVDVRNPDCRVDPVNRDSSELFIDDGQMHDL